jgi:PAS domain S-box-containing protein
LDARIFQISSLISEFSQRKFSKKIKISNKQDHIDGIIFALNILGEEMAETTISKNYFTSIFDSISDIIIVLNKSFYITNANNAFCNTFGYEVNNIKNNGLDLLLNTEDISVLKKEINRLSLNNPCLVREIEFLCPNNRKIPFLITVSKMFDEKNRWIGFLLVGKDYTFQKQMESVLLRTIIDTQEKERVRFANDIHDSLGQKLSALKFFLSSTINSTTSAEQKKILIKSNGILLTTIEEMRNICFAIMPSNLKDFGLIKAVKELVKEIKLHNKIEYKIKILGSLPKIDTSKEIILYRIIQELIGNSLKHSNASIITIVFESTPRNLLITFSDNGKGFDIKKIQKNTSGLSNIKTRVIACNGILAIKSHKDIGTKYEINLPLKQIS